MKLVHNLILILTLGVVTVLGVMAKVMARSEQKLIEANDREDLSSMARAITPALVRTWATSGPTSALALLEYPDEHVHETHEVGLRWVPLDSAPTGPGSDGRALTASERQTIRNGDEVFLTTPGDEGQLILYVPVKAAGVPAGALEVTKSMRQEREFLSAGLHQVLITAALLTALLGATSLIFVRLRVGRPLELLTAQARGLARGDLSARVPLDRADELGMISREMNRMAESLQSAWAKARTEQGARIATLEQLRHTDRLAMVGELAAGIAHELGTPLSVVIGRAKMIADGVHEGTQARGSAKIVAEQGERMTRIIRQLLNFARRQPTTKVRTDVVPIVRQTLSMLLPIATRRGVVLKLQEPEHAEEAVVEATQLEQALTNLVVNGIQAMHRGGTVTVELHEQHEQPPPDVSQPEGNYLSVEVRDEGDGIPEKNLPHVFDPFFTTKPIGEGTGLGLSVAYGIARDHGGWIDAFSREGGGSRFIIHLPIAGGGAP